MTTTTLDALRTRLDRFAAVVADVPAGRWAAPSPCAGWTAHDVLDHVVDSERDFLAGTGLDLGERPDGSPTALWAAHTTALTTLLAVDGVLEREYDGYFGRTTVGATLWDFHGFDLVVHRWDVARTADDATLLAAAAFSEEEMDHLERAAAGFGDALYADGVCAPPVAVPADAPRQDRILAVLGRDPR